MTGRLGDWKACHWYNAVYELRVHSQDGEQKGRILLHDGRPVYQDDMLTVLKYSAADGQWRIGTEGNYFYDLPTLTKLGALDQCQSLVTPA